MRNSKQLREEIAATLARYAPDAFSASPMTFGPCNAEFPQSFSKREAACYRKLADKVLEKVSASAKATK